MTMRKCQSCSDPAVVLDNEYDEAWCQRHWDAFSEVEKADASITWIDSNHDLTKPNIDP